MKKIRLSRLGFALLGLVALLAMGTAVASGWESEKNGGNDQYGSKDHNYGCKEQKNGEELDGGSDLYAVGVVLWEMLARRQLRASE